MIFVAVKAEIRPEPNDASPIEGFELIQLYWVPGMEPENVIEVVNVLWQKVWFATVLTVGVGFTVIAKSVVFPGQEFRVGVTV